VVRRAAIQPLNRSTTVRDWHRVRHCRYGQLSRRIFGFLAHPERRRNRPITHPETTAVRSVGSTSLVRDNIARFEGSEERDAFWSVCRLKPTYVP